MRVRIRVRFTITLRLGLGLRPLRGHGAQLPLEQLPFIYTDTRLTYLPTHFLTQRTQFTDLPTHAQLILEQLAFVGYAEECVLACKVRVGVLFQVRV